MSLANKQTRHGCGIYAICQRASGQVYVGSSKDIDKRWASHVRMLRRGNHHNAHLQHAWKKHGAQAFTFEVLELCPYDALMEREGFHMAELRSFERDRGFNLDPIVHGRVAQSAETRAKKSQARKGFKPDPAVLARGVATRRQNNNYWPPEAVAKRTATLTGRKQTPEHTAHIAQALKGHGVSERSRAASSARLKARWANPEYRARDKQLRVRRGQERSAEMAINAQARKDRKLAKKRKNPKFPKEAQGELTRLRRALGKARFRVGNLKTEAARLVNARRLLELETLLQTELRELCRRFGQTYTTTVWIRSKGLRT